MGRRFGRPILTASLRRESSSPSSTFSRSVHRLAHPAYRPVCLEERHGSRTYRISTRPLFLSHPRARACLPSGRCHLGTHAAIRTRRPGRLLATAGRVVFEDPSFPFAHRGLYLVRADRNTLRFFDGAAGRTDPVRNATTFSRSPVCASRARERDLVRRMRGIRIPGWHGPPGPAPVGLLCNGAVARAPGAISASLRSRSSANGPAGSARCRETGTRRRVSPSCEISQGRPRRRRTLALQPAMVRLPA